MSVRIINADVLDGLRQLDDESVHCVVTNGALLDAMEVPV